MSCYSCNFRFSPSRHHRTTPPAFSFQHQIGRERAPMHPPPRPPCRAEAAPVSRVDGFCEKWGSRRVHHDPAPRCTEAKSYRAGVRAGSQGEIRVSQFRVSYEIKSRHPGNRWRRFFFLDLKKKNAYFGRETLSSGRQKNREFNAGGTNGPKGGGVILCEPPVSPDAFNYRLLFSTMLIHYECLNSPWPRINLQPGRNVRWVWHGNLWKASPQHLRAQNVGFDEWTAAGRAVHAWAISDVIFTPPKMNTPHYTLNTTLENPCRITL